MAGWVIGLLLVAAAGLLGMFVNHNVGWWPRSRRRLEAKLNRALQLGTEWMITRPERDNVALLFMIADMANLSGDPRLQRIVRSYLDDPLLDSENIWRRLLDPTTTVKPPTRQQFDAYQDYQRWFLYAVAPQEVDLTAEDRADMFAPDRFVWGSRTHQLFALILHQSRQPSPAVTNLINHLCERIALEAHWDIRVTDLYLQRLALVLAAGRPDLIKRRWVERAIASQKQDGGWVASWYGWGPRLFEFSGRPRVPNSHTTVQGVWLLYMLRFRYPEWMEHLTR